MRYRKRKINGRTVSEHRLVFEEAHGPIATGLVVHHKNHDRLDNAVDNLEALTHAEHSRHHNQKHARTKLCTVCGAEFTPHPTKRARAKTCSPECAWQAKVAASRAFRGGSCRRCGDPGHRLAGCPIVLNVDPASVRAAHEAGESLRAIGRRLGLNRDRVRKLLGSIAAQLLLALVVSALGAFALNNNPVWVAPGSRAMVV